MGKCRIIDNLKDGLYTIEILKDTKRAGKMKESLDKKSTDLSAELAQLNVDKAAQQQIVDELAEEVNLLIDELALNPVDYDRLNKEITEVLVYLSEESLKLQKINADIDTKTNRLTLITKKISELSGVTEKKIRNAWSADLSEELTGEQDTIEINRENKTILIVPRKHEGAGQLQPTQSSGEMTTAYNLALLAEHQKWRPMYRTGTITTINEETNTCTVLLDSAKSSQQDLPINQGDVLIEVPITYMDCNAAAFTVRDTAIVYFVDMDFTRPQVVGFLHDPQPCFTHGFRFVGQDADIALKSTANGFGDTAKDNSATTEDSRDKWGALNWCGVNKDKETIISWNGATSRYSDKWFERSPIYEKGKIIKPAKSRMLTVGAGYAAGNLVVFYLDGRELAEDYALESAQNYISDNFPFTLICEITTPENELISSSIVMENIRQLFQIVCISSDGSKATTMLSLWDEPILPPVSTGELWVADYAHEAYERIIDINIMPAGCSISSNKLQTLLASTINNPYVPALHGTWSLKLPAAKVICVDYKGTERVDLTWEATGVDRYAFWSAANNDVDDIGLFNISHTYTTDFFSTTVSEESNYGRGQGGTIQLYKKQHGFIILGLDLRHNSVVYLDALREGFGYVDAPTSEYNSVASSVSAIVSGKTVRLTNTETFNHIESMSTERYFDKGSFTRDFLRIYRMGFRDGFNSRFAWFPKEPNYSRGYVKTTIEVASPDISNFGYYIANMHTDSNGNTVVVLMYPRYFTSEVDHMKQDLTFIDLNGDVILVNYKEDAELTSQDIRDTWDGNKIIGAI